MNQERSGEDRGFKEKREGAPEHLSQRPRPGATRCPFCHQECAPDANACACAECLSRHHAACWEEGRGCASCRATRRLEPARAREDVKGYGDVFGAWLKLGLVYDAGLVALCVAALGERLLLVPILVQVAVGAALANLCFLIGPAIDLIARRLGYRGAILRWLLFVSGFALALVLALDCCHFLKKP